jgi:hypothetical protein
VDQPEPGECQQDGNEITENEDEGEARESESRIARVTQIAEWSFRHEFSLLVVRLKIAQEVAVHQDEPDRGEKKKEQAQHLQLAPREIEWK